MKEPAEVLDYVLSVTREGDVARRLREKTSTIDAEKHEYDAYYELVLQLIRPGGLIALDNMLRDGRVADPSVTERGTAAIRALNEKIFADKRVDASLLTIRDGVMLVRKR